MDYASMTAVELEICINQCSDEVSTIRAKQLEIHGFLEKRNAADAAARKAGDPALMQIMKPNSSKSIAQRVAELPAELAEELKNFFTGGK